MSVDPRIEERVRGPAWDGIRQAFSHLLERVLAVGPDTRAELTTIYVKFSISCAPNAPVYAVAWLKTAKNVVIGFSLPEDADDPLLMPAPSGMRYKGITKYFRLTPGESLPAGFSDWAHRAFLEATSGGKKRSRND
jgi:hypothetical protein